MSKSAVYEYNESAIAADLAPSQQTYGILFPHPDEPG